MGFEFGGIKLKNNIFLAPMAGVTDAVFRRICHSHGCALSYTEMVSAKALSFESGKTKSMTETEGFPTAVQIFGHEPDVVACIAATASEQGLFLDINMGCPAPKIVKNGDGSALMRSPKLAGEIVKAAVKASRKPVSVKMRLGWDEASKNAVEIAKRCEDAGAFAVTVHGRTREQFYSGEADREEIARVRESISIPLVANGDVKSAKDAKRILDVTGAAAVMIGRGAQGNPWIFEETAYYFETGRDLERPSDAERIAEAVRHVEMLCDMKGEYIGIREARKHASWYISGMNGAAKARENINRAESIDEMRKALGMIICDKE